MAPKLTISTTVRLASGYEMPRLGLGVYQTPADKCEALVLHAFSKGYRHIDSATAYRNERPCATAIAASSLSRTEVFFTTKLPPRLRGYEETKKSLNNVITSNPELEGYIDLYLIHAPYGGRTARLGEWKAMVEAHKEGKIRSLGVSNYSVDHLNELWKYIHEEGGGGVLSVGQWEVTPWLGRRDIRKWCEERGVVVQAYSPLVRATRFGEPVVRSLAERYGATPAQVLVRWSLQMGLVPLPKSVHPERITENADVYGFELSKEEMKELETDEYSPCSWDPTKEPL
ncbi:uncharacterized protein LAJ45_02614 [Morchella importuna]|uniref:uncharacterized protein n=1 Tax=Morchella importuna TaxID=1174673 RepID=UPI001E8D056D|nr:uncharacterized protein LAJ45_02614 [Morchella importuna]KAH8153027.1 hypothetical protein LAJ45_02614 [Morchella importuna]